MPLISFRRRKQTPNQPQTDWLDNAAFVVKLASATGELLPFPYLKGAAALVSTLLEPIQQMQQNKEDYQALTISVTNILQTLHKEILQDLQGRSCSERLEEQCLNLYTCLQRISGEIQEPMRVTNVSGYRQFLTTGRIKTRLTSYEKEMDGLWKIFMISNVHRPLSQFRNILLGDVEIIEVFSRTNGSFEYGQIAARQEAYEYIADNLVAPNCFMVDAYFPVNKASIRYFNTLGGYLLVGYVNIADGRVIFALGSLHDLRMDLPKLDDYYSFINYPKQITERGWSIEAALSMTQQAETNLPTSVGCTTQQLLWAFYVYGFSWHFHLATGPHKSTKYPQADEIYNFVPPQSIQNDTLEMYWSMDATGTEKLTALDMASFGLMEDSLEVIRKMWLCSVPEDQYQHICEIHKNLGIDPESNEAAHMFGFPLYTFPDELGESEDCNDTDDSDYATADEGDSTIGAHESGL
ncbi:hypothetical protein M422DRAFT_274260 [Sphaerobolus stellatus SS14]|uniref:Uncharacterized protein n=1 Tax=Sphaerobolus stellatus (strain SS14) TaxID=990650 RepID=A0A0C9UHJ0_SPHS4|nr:hypothetical protein M422DRAFT_274260 [Sphaerobolus stellatus SS14]